MNKNRYLEKAAAMGLLAKGYQTVLKGARAVGGKSGTKAVTGTRNWIKNNPGKTGLAAGAIGTYALTRGNNQPQVNVNIDKTASLLKRASAISTATRAVGGKTKGLVARPSMASNKSLKELGTVAELGDNKYLKGAYANLMKKNRTAQIASGIRSGTHTPTFSPTKRAA